MAGHQNPGAAMACDSSKWFSFSSRGQVLQTYREAEHADWQSVFGEGAWQMICVVSIERLEVHGVFEGIVAPGSACHDAILFDGAGNEVSDVDMVLTNALQAIRDGSIAPLEMDIDFSEELYVHLPDALTRICGLKVQAEFAARKYPLNLRFREGRVLQDLGAPDPAFRQLVSEGFEWEKLIEDQPGETISASEYAESARSASLNIPLSGLKRWIRFVATEHKNEKRGGRA